jgi:hypothetical protein
MSHHPINNSLLYIYTKSFMGQLGYLLRDKNPKTIQDTQELARKIKGNLHSSKIELFSNPRGKMDTTPKTFQNIEPTSYLCVSMEKLQETMDGMIKNQELMMNRIDNLERAHRHEPRVPYKGQFQRGNQVYKLNNDQ